MDNTQQQPELPKVWTVLDVLKWSSDYLNQKAVESPRLTIELILCSVLQCRRVDLYLRHDQPLSKFELQKIRTMLQRILRNEPIQYVLGSTSFLGLTVVVTSDVLIPRPETELVALAAIQHAKSFGRDIRVLDIGTGSGCLALAIKSAIGQRAQVLGVDISQPALLIASKNAERNSLNVRFRQVDLLSDAILSLGDFDLVVSNPPYIGVSEYQELEPVVKDFEPRIALTDGGDGFAMYRRICAILPRLLKPGGVCVLELGHSSAQLVSEMFGQSGYFVQIEKDYSGIDRILTAQRYQDRPSEVADGKPAIGRPD